MLANWDISYASLFFSAIFNFSLASLFYYFRRSTNPNDLTTSQRWTLTALFWLFMLNGMIQFVDSFATIGFREGNLAVQYLGVRVLDNLNVVIPFLFIALGLIYPRPYTTWKTLEKYLFLIICAIVFFMFVAIYAHFIEFDYDGYFLYYPGYFIPIFIWLYNYHNQVSSQSRIILTILIWGLFMTPFMTTMITISYIAFGLGGMEPNPLVSVLCLLALIVLLRAIFIHRDQWSKAESYSVFFIGFAMALVGVNAAYNILVMHGTNYSMDDLDLVTDGLVILTGHGTWSIIRPLLFAYGMLRYQIFGTQLKVERAISMFAAFLVSLFFGLLGGLMAYSAAGLAPGIATAVLLTIVLIFPLMRLTSAAIIRVLPASRGQETISMAERRSTYLITLQTAVVDGKIDLPEDEGVLARLRESLHISQREHDLLMESHELGRPARAVKPSLNEIFLIFSDGRLISHVSVQKDLQQDKDVVAGMLVAIRGFVAEGFRSNQSELDSIRYGEFSLAIETEDELVMAAVVKGKVTSELRQLLRDNLIAIKKAYCEKLTNWSGDLNEMKDIEVFLRKML